MRAKLHGEGFGAAAAVVGGWDPIVPAHRHLFAKLSRHGRRSKLTSLAIALEPNPGRLVHGPDQWPVYSDLETRISEIRACGIDAVLVIRFARSDLDLGAREFLSTVRAQIRVRELWLGANQSLGFGPGGSGARINRLCGRLGIVVRRLSDSDAGKQTRLARRALWDGRVAGAARFTNRPPVWGRPRSRRLFLAWRTGTYWAVPLDNPLAQIESAPCPIHLFAAARSLSRLDWPDSSIRYLAFVRGPGDSPRRG